MDADGTESAGGWRDRLIWVFLALATLVFVVIATGSWWATQNEEQRVTDGYVCAIDPSSEDC